MAPSPVLTGICFGDWFSHRGCVSARHGAKVL